MYQFFIVATILDMSVKRVTRQPRKKYKATTRKNEVKINEIIAKLTTTNKRIDTGRKTEKNPQTTPQSK